MLVAGILVLLQAAPDPGAVSPERIRATLRAVCAETRLAGSPASRAAADYAARVFAEAGLRVERSRYEVFLPRQTSESLVLLQPDGSRKELDLKEQGYALDPSSQRDHVPPMHGLTRPGRVRGRLVYAGRGTAAEFEALRRDLGGELVGSVALMRYGGLYRGLKVQNAADAGCAGALLYTDPEDDGARKGRTLPRGKWRPGDSIQRGSVFNRDGDPLTPGWPALPGARRLQISEARGLVPIPSLPVSWRNAARLFGSAGRPAQPARLEARVELEVVQDPSPVTIEDVLGWIEGSKAPDEWVILGGHRDAWGFGAVDNGTGTAVILETARVLGAALRRGWRPERSIALATWDGEEWGLVGSTEWVEEHLGALRRGGVAYVNMDTVVSGPDFGASCTPGMAGLLRSVCGAEDVPPPSGLGNPGGGSDHVPFLELAGMEVLNFGFSGGQGSYHSALDTPYVVERFLDPDFSIHARAGRLAVRLATQISRRQARLDGVEQWAARAAGAVSRLELQPAFLDRLRTAAAELVAAGRGQAPLREPFLFLRSFLPAGSGRCLLWRTQGYGAAWYPEIVEALADGRDPGPAVDRAAAALRRAARAMLPPDTAGR